MYIALLRYGELTLKGKNKQFFLNKLKKRIKEVFCNEKNIEIKVNNSRAYLFFNNKHNFFSNEEIKRILILLNRIFGLTSVSFGFLIENNNIENISETSIFLLKSINYQNKTLKIDTRRNYKKYYLKSLEVSKHISDNIFQKIKNIRCDVKKPEILISIEIFKKYTTIVFNKYNLLDGMPNDTLGKGLLMLSGGIDSPVAGYLAMKKGINIIAINFIMPPYTSKKSEEKVEELVKKITNYQKDIILYKINITKLQLKIRELVADNYRITVLRAFMYLLSESIAKYLDCKIIINGESLGQVASQTLESIYCLHTMIEVPVFQPVGSFTKNEIIKIAKLIDTYEISIQPYEDCCSLFLPRNPITRPKKEKLFKEINKISSYNIEEMVDIEKKIISFSSND